MMKNIFAAVVSIAVVIFYLAAPASASPETSKRSVVDMSLVSTEPSKDDAKTIVFSSLPASVEDLKRMPGADLISPHSTAALTIAALCRYASDPQATIEMLNVLKGPESVSAYEAQFIAERLRGKEYKPRSFFAGATPSNDYEPTRPYTITVSSTPHSFIETDRATLYVKSGGADSPRPIMLRRKPSTGQWFLVEIGCLADIRTPAGLDPWS